MYFLPCLFVVTMGYHVPLDVCFVTNLRVPPMNLCIGVGTHFLDSPVETLGHSLKYFVLVG